VEIFDANIYIAKDPRPAGKSAKFPRDFNIARNTGAAQASFKL